jgi:hypothetical protein
LKKRVRQAKAGVSAKIWEIAVRKAVARERPGRDAPMAEYRPRKGSDWPTVAGGGVELIVSYRTLVDSGALIKWGCLQGREFHLR